MTFDQMNDDAKVNYLIGQMTLIRDLIDKHKAEEFKTVDEMVGDLHLTFIEAFNTTHALMNSESRLSLGDLIQ